MKNQITKLPAESESASPETTNLTRRGFMRTSALAAAGAGAAGLFKPSTAEAASGVEGTTYGQGPFAPSPATRPS